MSIGLVASDRSQASVAVRAVIADRKRALPAIGGIGRGLIETFGSTCARSILELFLAGQGSPGPAGKGQCIVISDVDYRQTVAAKQRAAEPFRMTPVRTFHIAPPLIRRCGAFQKAGRIEHDRGTLFLGARDMARGVKAAYWALVTSCRSIQKSLILAV